MCFQSLQLCPLGSCTTPHPTHTKSKSFVSPRTQLHLALQAQETPQPGSLNLIPCTAREYSQLCDSIEDKYELVHGRLLWRKVPDRQHLDIQAFLHYLLLLAVAQGLFKIVWYIEPTVNFVNPYEVTDAKASSSKSTKDKDFRIADFAIGDYYDSETRHNFSPNSSTNPFSIKRLPRVVMEITSLSNYKNDVNDKWKQYARFKIPEYYIIDRKRQCVVRGFFDTQAQYLSGDCEESSRLNPKDAGDQIYYCREVFRGDQKIRGDYLGKLNITANEMLNPPHLPDRVKEVEMKRKETEEETKKEMALYREEREKAEKRVREFKDVTRTLFNDLQSEKGKKKVAEEERKVAEKERKVAEKEREVAEKERKVAEKEREVAEKERKVAEKELKEWKASEENLKAKFKDLEARLAEYMETVADPSIGESVMSLIREVGER